MTDAGVERCHSCGEPLPRSARFCGACGQTRRSFARERGRVLRVAARRDRRAIRAIVLVFVGVLGSVLTAAVLSALGGEFEAAQWWIVPLEITVGLAAAAVMGYGALRRSFGTAPDAGSLGIAPFVGLGTFAVSWAWVAGLAALLGVESAGEQASLGVVVSVVVLAPVVEEWLCRGVLWDAASRAGSERTALLTTSLLFALLHCLGGPWHFPHRFLAGLAFGWLRLRSGSLVPGIVAHAAHNALALSVM